MALNVLPWREIVKAKKRDYFETTTAAAATIVMNSAH